MYCFVFVCQQKNLTDEKLDILVYDDDEDGVEYARTKVGVNFDDDSDNSMYEELIRPHMMRASTDIEYVYFCTIDFIY